jgi:hypothetical protein
MHISTHTHTHTLHRPAVRDIMNVSQHHRTCLTQTLPRISFFGLANFFRDSRANVVGLAARSIHTFAGSKPALLHVLGSSSGLTVKTKGFRVRGLGIAPQRGGGGGGGEGGGASCLMHVFDVEQQRFLAKALRLEANGVCTCDTCHTSHVTRQTSHFTHNENQSFPSQRKEVFSGT